MGYDLPMNKFILAAAVCGLCLAASPVRAQSSILSAPSTNSAAVVAAPEPKDDVAVIKRELQRINEKLDNVLSKGESNQRIEQVLKDLTRKIDDLARDVDRLDDKVDRIGRN